METITAWGLRLAGRAAVFGAALVAAAVWTNGLLRVTRDTTEVLLDASQLAAFAMEPKEQPAGEQADDKQADDKQADDGRPDDQTTAPETTVDAMTEPQPVETRPANDERLADVSAARKDSIEPLESVLAESPPEPPPESVVESLADGGDESLPEFTPGEAGSVAGFAGSSVVGAGMGEETGTGRGVSWRIRIEGRASLAQLTSLPGTYFAAVRPGRETWKLVLLHGSRLDPPTGVEDFVRAHPEFQGGRGVSLDPRLLDPVRDRLLTYGSGWHAWLLVEDRLFAQWTRAAQEEIERQGVRWEQVAWIEGSVQARRPHARPEFVFEKLELKPRTDADAGGQPSELRGNPTQGDSKQETSEPAAGLPVAG